MSLGMGRYHKDLKIAAPYWSCSISCRVSKLKMPFCINPTAPSVRKTNDGFRGRQSMKKGCLARF